MAFAVALTACASTNSRGNGFTGNGSTGDGNSFRASSARTLTPEAKLALGTIKLEGTQQAVDANTAGKLLPLWQLMVQLQSSSSTAPQEVTAVTDAIKAAMTPQQVTTIEGMSVTTADIFSLLQSEAQASGSGSGRTGSSGFGGRNNRQGGRQFFFAGGPGGAGGPPGDFGGGAFRNANGNGSSSASPADPSQAAQAAQARENATSILVENQVIRLLEAKLSRQPG
jgi:hypothetical protein